MSLLTRESLPYPTYDLMLEHILSQIQERLKTPLDEIVQQEISPNLLNRINQIARSAYNDLKITYFTYDEMAAILETEEIIIKYKGQIGILFILLKPVVELVETDEGRRMSITMSLDFQFVN